MFPRSAKSTHFLRSLRSNEEMLNNGDNVDGGSIAAAAAAPVDAATAPMVDEDHDQQLQKIGGDRMNWMNPEMVEDYAEEESS